MAENNPPLIGVVPLVDEGRDSYWMLPGYFEGVLEAGGVPVMLPLTDDPEVLAELVSSCSGILVTGGQDVSPELYGEHGAEVAALCGELCAARDKMESVLIPLAVRDDVPMLGICRGIQAARYGRTCPSRDPPRSSTMAFLRTRNPCMRWTLFRQLRWPRRLAPDHTPSTATTTRH